MSLSWGRRASRQRDALLRVVFAVSVVVAAAVASPSDGPDLGARPSIIGSGTMGRIQALLDQHVDAISRQDLFAYERTLDRRTIAFQRCMREFYELGDLRVQALGPNRLLRLEQVSPSLVRAYVEQRNGIAVRYVRRLQVINIWSSPPFDIRTGFVVWYLSQPDPAELGSVRAREHDGVTLTHWQIDDHAADALLREAVAARDMALEHAPAPLPPSMRLRLLPFRELASVSRSCLTTGYYEAAPDEILVYRYWLDPGRAKMSAKTRQTLRHEALHWVQWHAVPRVDRADWWLREGWADHMAGGTDELGLLPRHLCGPEASPPFEGEWLHGPGPIASGERSLFLYSAARSLAGHAFRSAEGAAYWSLLAALSAGGPRDEAYRGTVGSSFDELRSEWAEALRAERC